MAFTGRMSGLNSLMVGRGSRDTLISWWMESYVDGFPYEMTAMEMTAMKMTAVNIILVDDRITLGCWTGLDTSMIID